MDSDPVPNTGPHLGDIMTVACLAEGCIEGTFFIMPAKGALAHLNHEMTNAYTLRSSGLHGHVIWVKYSLGIIY